MRAFGGIMNHSFQIHGGSFGIQKRSQMSFGKAILLVGLFDCCSVWALGQRVTATLQGVVLDQTGAAIANAAVRVINEDTNSSIELKSSREGRFSAPALSVGTYTIRISQSGFKQLEQHGVSLSVDQTVDLDLTMSPGSMTESVMVTTDVPLLNTETSDSGATIQNKEIVDLPLNQRNPYTLVMLTPGVTGSTSASFLGMTFNVNGGRQGTSDVLLNGVSSAPATDSVNALSIFPSVDAVQEFKVQTSNYSAEYGLSGGGIINVIFKSGANQIHGSVYDFLRNSYTDANDFFANRARRPLGAFKRNQFGGTIGGPIVVPHVFDGRNRSFFFFGYEGLRQNSQSTITATVPTGAMRSGDFSSLTTSIGQAITLYDPNTTTVVNGVYQRQRFAGNIIPANRINPVAANVVKYYPLPNQPGTNGTNINNYFASASAKTTVDQVDGKLDEIFRENHHLSFSFSIRQPAQNAPRYFPSAIQVAQTGSDNTTNALGGVLDYVYTVTPTNLFEIRYGTFGINLKSRALGDGIDPSSLGLPNYISANAQQLQFPGFGASGYLTLGSGSQLAEGSVKYSTQSWIVSNTKAFSRHIIKAGFETRFLRNKSNQVGRSTGDFAFNPLLTQGPVATTASSTAGDGFASLLLGVGTGTLTKNFKIVDTSSRYFGAYIQDDWKASTRLTVNIGIRYELLIPRTEKLNRASWFDPNIASPLAQTTSLASLKGGLVFVGVNSGSKYQSDPQYTNISPRIGFSYELSKRVVVRSAFGVFYANAPNEAAQTIQQVGYRTDSVYTGTVDNGITQTAISNPYPTGTIPVTGSSAGLLTSVGSSITSAGRRSPTPYSEQWLLDLQYELPRSWLIDAAYVGTNGLQLIRLLAANQIPNQYLSMGSKLLAQVPNPFYGRGLATGPLSGQTVQQNYLLAPFPQFSSINLQNYPGGFSSYNSLQLQLQKRFSDNLTLRMSFTGSKFMDNSSQSNSNFLANGTTQDATNLASDWALSTADVSKRFVGAITYKLPFGARQLIGANWNRMANSALGGWSVNTIVTAQTGQPLALSAANNLSNLGPGLRPNSNGQNPHLDGRIEDRLNAYFKMSVYSQPAPFTYGNVSRTIGTIRTPGLRNIDLSLFKDFTIVERLKAQLRVEAFNAFNTPQFGSPTTNVSSASFGVITSQANAPRQLQVALKILF
jgi:hypothetical protein